nr:unnamed protein product [Digitaria exilis]
MRFVMDHPFMFAIIECEKAEVLFLRYVMDPSKEDLLADVSTWPQLSFAAGVFVDRTLHLTPAFVASVASAHQAVARSVDFMDRPAAAIAEANDFIAQGTAGRLRNVLSEDTARQPVRVPFLSDAGVQYAESFDVPGLGFKVLQRFYKMARRDGKLDLGSPCFCMLVFLPHDRRDGLARLLRMAVDQPDFVMRCAPRREQLVSPCMVPKFRFSSRLDAVSALCQLGLGLTAPFDKGVADLSRMVSNVPPEGLYVSAVTQTCAVKVDEEGTTAVAAMYAA